MITDFVTEFKNEVVKDRHVLVEAFDLGAATVLIGGLLISTGARSPQALYNAVPVALVLQLIRHYIK